MTFLVLDAISEDGELGKGRYDSVPWSVPLESNADNICRKEMLTMASAENQKSAYRFQVALSFPGKYRDRVEKIAQLLAERLGPERVLYDSWYSAEFARPNFDTYLSSLYYKQSRLLVFFLSEDHAEREWTGLEWRAGRDLLKRREDDRLMFLRLDASDIPGLYSIDGYMDVAQLPDDIVASEIMKRLNDVAPAPRPSIESTVQSLRAAVIPAIRERCSRIRVLSMEKAVDLSSVYTDVLMSEKRTAQQLRTKGDLLRDVQQDGFGRFGLLVGETVRVEGSRAFDNDSRVIVYGKPGSGKTTFLKHLATECANERFRPDLVPIFVTLRDYADVSSHPALHEYIEGQWNKNPNGRTVLDHGLAFLLLDGLDEVRNLDFTRIRKAIEAFAREFPLCIIALTCRIAAREYSFENFTEVEMADFDEEQIVSFSTRWFSAHNETQKARAFLDKLKANSPLRELASNPLLLTLLCLVFQDRNDFDGNRADLYKQGLDILLYRWDARRDIERDFPVGVTRAVLESLLSEIAYTRFLTGEFFFGQTKLEEQIAAFLQRRPGRHDNPVAEPAQVLNSVEAHIGLLVARAMNVYSFSHLTFQEYLTAQQVVRKPSLLLKIGPHIGNQQWREVWLLLSTMLDPDDILMEIKTAVDLLVINSPKIQKMLESCMHRANRFSKGAASQRAIYFGLEMRYEIAFRSILSDFDLGDDRASPNKPIKSTTLEVAINEGFTISLEGQIPVRLNNLAEEKEDEFMEKLKVVLVGADRLASSLGIGSASNIILDMTLMEMLIRGEALMRAVDSGIFFPRALGITQSLHVVQSEAERVDVALATELQDCRQIFAASSTEDLLRGRYKTIFERLKAVAFERRGIGLEWRFTNEEKALLEQYERANRLVVDCMNAAEGLTTEARQQIETTMLLPYEEVPDFQAWEINPALKR